MLRDSLSFPTTSSDESGISTDLKTSRNRSVKVGTKEVVMTLAADIRDGKGKQIKIKKVMKEQLTKGMEQVRNYL